MPHPFFEIVQDQLPVKPWVHPATRRLPGIQPLDLNDWIWADSAFARQMAYRDHLLQTKRDKVTALRPAAQEAADELLGVVLEHLESIAGYCVKNTYVKRPDDVEIVTDHANAIETLLRLVQQDFCILTKDQSEHVLQAAALCFPASWTLAEKIGHPMIRIHKPVEEYDSDLAKRVQNLFDRMHVDRPLWRANCLIYSNPDLFQPQQEGYVREPQGSARWVRVERQSLRKLPQTGAIVFGIHTCVVPFDQLSKDEQKAVAAFSETI